MARIAGIDLPKNKRSLIGLTYIYGIGKTSAHKILSSAGIDENKKVGDLTEDEITLIRQVLTNEYKVEGVARSEMQLAVKRLIYDENDKPVQWLHGLYRPDRYEYQMQLSRVGGIDAKVGIGTNLVFDATWRTDFSQVETDAQQINLTRFSLFFPEKREFFLENQGAFQIGPPASSASNLVPFFSRT